MIFGNVANLVDGDWAGHGILEAKELNLLRYTLNGDATCNKASIISSTFNGLLTAKEKFFSRNSTLDRVITHDSIGEATCSKIKRITISPSNQNEKTCSAYKFYLYDKSQVDIVEFKKKPGTVYYDATSKAPKVINGQALLYKK